jgi:hypothetical protein
MELMGDAESSSAARVTARRFLQDDPQDQGGLRQGSITLIHSAPTGDDASRHSGMVRQHQISGAQLRTGESRASQVRNGAP